MRSPQIVYNVATGTFEAEFDEDGLDTFFVFPPDMEDGDNLPSIIIRLEGEEEPFQFDGKYNKDSRNMEFLFDGPPGYSFKMSISIDPGLNEPYIWKTKKHGQTSGGNAMEDAVVYIPKYVCMNTAAMVSAKEDIILKWSFFGTTVQDLFCVMRLKIKLVSGSRYYSEVIMEKQAPVEGAPMTVEPIVPEGEAPEGVAVKFTGGEKCIEIKRMYKVTVTKGKDDSLIRQARRKEKILVFDACLAGVAEEIPIAEEMSEELSHHRETPALLTEHSHTMPLSAAASSEQPSIQISEVSSRPLSSVSGQESSALPSQVTSKQESSPLASGIPRKKKIPEEWRLSALLKKQVKLPPISGAPEEGPKSAGLSELKSAPPAAEGEKDTETRQALPISTLPDNQSSPIGADIRASEVSPQQAASSPPASMPDRVGSQVVNASGATGGDSSGTPASALPAATQGTPQETISGERTMHMSSEGVKSEGLKESTEHGAAAPDTRSQSVVAGSSEKSPLAINLRDSDRKSPERQDEVALSSTSHGKKVSYQDSPRGMDSDIGSDTQQARQVKKGGGVMKFMRWRSKKHK